jgi:hypothetical protein
MDPAASNGGRTARREALMAATACAVLYASLAVVMLWPALTSGGRLGGKDWNAFIGQAQAEAETLLQWNEFPAWNPWRRGGQVSFAQPESMLLTPVTPMALRFGAVLAFKLLLVPLFVACGLGLRALARDLGLRGAAAALPGALFLCAGPLPLYVNGGLPNWLFGMAILPWLLLASRRAATHRGWLIGGAALFALLLFAGSVHHFVFFPLLLAAEALARAIRERSVVPLLRSAALGVAGVALSLVRLVPLLELFSEFPRRLDASGRFMPPELMARSLLLPHPEGALEGLTVTVQGGSVLYWVDCGAFVGPVAALLACVAILAAWRAAWPFALIGGAFAWLAAGSGVQPSLWDALHRLPVYESMQAPERFMGYIAFAIVLLAGFGAAEVVRWVERRGAGGARLVAGATFVLAVAPLLWFDAEIARSAFPVAAPTDVTPTRWGAMKPARAPFAQGRFANEREQWGGPLYEAVLRNRGNVDGQSDVPSLPAAKALDALDYRGEAFLAEGRGEITALEMTPNRARVAANLTAPDRLVVNQTWFPGWRDAATGRRCEPHAGLIALPLEPGAHQVELEFAPASIPIAAGLSALALAVLLAWSVALRRERRRMAASVAAGASVASPAAPRPGAPFSWERYAAQRGLPAPLRLLPADVGALAAACVMAAGVMGWHARREPCGASPPIVPWRETAIAVAADDGGALQRAVDGAAAGAVVRLAAGDYERAVIRRGVTLVADPLGGARLRHLVIEDLAAGERVAVLGVALGAAAPAPVERGTLRIERCTGPVVVQGAGEIASPPIEPPDLTIRGSVQVVLLDVSVAEAEVTDSTVAAARLRASGLGAERATVAVSDSECGAVELREGGRLHRAGSRDGAPGQPPPPSALSLRLTQPLGDGRSARIELRGPPGAKGTLIVARDAELVALKGRNLGQLRGPRFDGREILFPFELPSSGEQRIPVIPVAEDSRPGDGWFFQAFLKADESDGAAGGLTYSAMDGGLLDPPR